MKSKKKGVVARIFMLLSVVWAVLYFALWIYTAAKYQSFNGSLAQFLLVVFFLPIGLYLSFVSIRNPEIILQELTRPKPGQTFQTKDLTNTKDAGKLILTLFVGYFIWMFSCGPGFKLFLKKEKGSLWETIQCDNTIFETDNLLYKNAKESLENYSREKGGVSTFLLDNIVSGKSPIDENTIAVLKDTASIIETIKKATQQEFYDDILIKHKDVALVMCMPSYFPYVSLNRMLLLQARYDQKNARYTDAGEDVLSSLRLLAHLAESQPDNFVKAIIYRISQRMATPVVEDTFKSSEYSRDYYKDLLQRVVYIDQNFSPHRIFLGERYDMANGFSQGFENLAKKDAGYNKEFWVKFRQANDNVLPKKYDLFLEALENRNPAINYQVYRAKVAILNNEDYENLPPDLKKIKLSDMFSFEGGLKKFPFAQDVKRVEDYARLFTQSFSQSFYRMSDLLLVIQVDLRHLITAAAIQLYKLDHGRLPDNLDQLTPDYLTAIPEDPFDYYRPMKYIHAEKGYKVYSIGLDRIDQGGAVVWQPDEDQLLSEDKNGDIVFSLE